MMAAVLERFVKTVASPRVIELCPSDFIKFGLKLLARLLTSVNKIFGQFFILPVAETNDVAQSEFKRRSLLCMVI
jgi:hypothetical protein